MAISTFRQGHIHSLVFKLVTNNTQNLNMVSAANKYVSESNIKFHGFIT